jgi:hypothetical protein
MLVMIVYRRRMSLRRASSSRYDVEGSDTCFSQLYERTGLAFVVDSWIGEYKLIWRHP